VGSRTAARRDRARRAPAGLRPTGPNTIEADGAHYVSPSRTLVGVYADLLRVLEPGDLADLLGAVN
jgi:hypothetical protein